jgi:hypothetical protein
MFGRVLTVAQDSAIRGRFVLAAIPACQKVISNAGIIPVPQAVIVEVTSYACPMNRWIAKTAGFAKKVKRVHQPTNACRLKIQNAVIIHVSPALFAAAMASACQTA